MSLLLCATSWCFQVPVPVFLPTTLQNAEQIVKTINELKAKMPFDLLKTIEAMGDGIALDEDEKPDCSGENVLKHPPLTKLLAVFILILVIITWPAGTYQVCLLEPVHH